MGGAPSALPPRSNQASRSYHKDGAKNRGRIVAERTAPDDHPKKQGAAKEAANHTANNVAQLVVAWAGASAGAFPVSDFSGQPTGNRAQQDPREDIQP